MDYNNLEVLVFFSSSSILRKNIFPSFFLLLQLCPSQIQPFRLSVSDDCLGIFELRLKFLEFGFVMYFLFWLYFTV